MIEVEHLSYAFAGHPPVLRDLSFRLDSGARCLLVGRNGAGKSTLLQVLAGRHMIPEEHVRLLGRSAFHDTSLVQDVAFIGGVFPFDTDITVAEILSKLPSGDRRDELIAVLGVNLDWHLHRVSDGQRRRVQLLLALLRHKRVLLLDEATSDLDVLARLDLLGLLKRDAERGTTIVYATHVFDRLEAWATHLMWLDQGTIRFLGAFDPAQHAPLLETVERWLR